MRALLPALLACLAGCGADDPPPDRLRAVEVQLVEPGAEPRAPLRLSPDVGALQRIRVTLSGRFFMEVDGKEGAAGEMPRLEVDIEGRVIERRDDGAHLVRLLFERIETDREIPGEPGGRLGLWLSPELEGSTIELVVGPRGRYHPTRESASEPALLSLPLAFFLPLPVEPVGLGARWESRRRPVSHGLAFEETTTYRLDAHEADHLLVGVEVRQRREPGEVTMPGGQTMTVVSWEGRAEGHGTLPLGGVLIRSAQFTWRMETVHLLRRGDTSVQAATRFRCYARIEELVVREGK